MRSLTTVQTLIIPVVKKFSAWVFFVIFVKHHLYRDAEQIEVTHGARVFCEDFLATQAIQMHVFKGERSVCDRCKNPIVKADLVNLSAALTRMSTTLHDLDIESY